MISIDRIYGTQFRATAVGVLFNLPHDTTMAEGRRLVMQTEQRLIEYGTFPTAAYRVKLAILPDYGRFDPLLSDEPTNDTLFGLHIPEFLRRNIVRRAPSNKSDRYEWVKNWLPNINLQLLASLRGSDLAFTQPDGFDSQRTVSVWKGSIFPGIPQDYKIGDPAPPPILTPGDFDYFPKQEPTRLLDARPCDRTKHTFFWLPRLIGGEEA